MNGWENGPPPGMIDPDAPDPEPPPDGKAAVSTKDAERVIAAVSAHAELFHDPKGAAYAAVRLERRRAVLRLSSRAMRSWIARTARETNGKSVGAAAIDEALVTLDGIARFDRAERALHLRVAEHEGAICVDLGDDSGAYLRVTAEGWSVRDDDAPVMFRRPDAMRPLPRPVRGGKLDELRGFVNLPDDDSHYLFAAWLVAALRPGRPFTILALHGEQGTAKTTVSRVARAFVDPNAAPVRSAPRAEDDLAVATVHSHVVAFDNLSGVQPWLSDALCRLATGGGLSKRTLYSDDDETVIDAIRPVIVNGIDDLANRADLAERCLVLTLQPISKRQRRDETTFWRAFLAAAPRIFGAVLDGVASALRELPNVKIAELPRMADFAMWAVAAEPGLGLPPGTLLGAYERNRTRVVDLALDASPVATAVRKLLDLPKHAGKWDGEPEQALAALSSLVSDETRRHPSWPKSASALSGKLRRSATFLRTVGVTLDLDGSEGRGDEKRRVWRLARLRATEDAVPSDPASPTAKMQNDRGDDGCDQRCPAERPHGDTDPDGNDAGTTPSAIPTPLNGAKSKPWERRDDGDDDRQASLLGGRFAGLPRGEGTS